MESSGDEGYDLEGDRSSPSEEVKLEGDSGGFRNDKASFYDSLQH